MNNSIPIVGNASGYTLLMHSLNISADFAPDSLRPIMGALHLYADIGKKE